jgi:hypothetical protein
VIQLIRTILSRIAEALREKLRGNRCLYREYKMASQDADRLEVLADWDAIETEGFEGR